MILFNLNFRNNKKGIGTVFGMVFFLLIVMVVFASFVVILNQNTGLEQTVMQTRQMDNNRANEQLTITGQATYSGADSVAVNCILNNTGTLPVQVVRLWVKDQTNGNTGNLSFSSQNIIISQGSNWTRIFPVTVPEAASDHIFRFWFETSRGNQFTLQQLSGGAGSTTNIYQNTTTIQQSLSQVLGDFLMDFHSVEWAFVTTNNGISVTGPWQSGWIVPTGSNTQSLAFRLNMTYYGSSNMRIDNDTNIIFDNLQDTSIVFEGTSNGVYPTVYISNYDSTTQNLNSYNGHEITVNASANPAPFTMYFSTIQNFGYSWWTQGGGSIYPVGSPSPAGYPLDSIEPNAMMTLILYGMSPSTYAQSFPLFSIQSRPISIQLSVTSGSVGTQVNVTGTDFAANKGISIKFDSTQITVPSTQTNANGDFGPLAFNVPPSVAGAHTVTATDNSVSLNAAIATFTVTPNVTSITPSKGVSGTPVVLNGQGFAANSQLVVTFDGLAVSPPPANALTDATGSFSNLGFTAPASLVPGAKIVNVTDANRNSNITTFNLLFGSLVSIPTIVPQSPISLGTSITASVTVSGVAGFTPTGTVTFQNSSDGGLTWSTFGAVKTLVSGSATSDSCTPRAPRSNYQFRAVYSGDGSYINSTGSASSLTVNPATPSVSIPTLTPLSPITLSASIRGTVTVTGVLSITPIGTVTFYVSNDSGSTWNTFGEVKNLVSGSATSDSYTPQTSGNAYQFRGVYDGDSNYNSANGTAVTLTVNKGTASVSASLFVPASPITLGSSVTVSASVSPPSGTTTVPTGTVQFMVKVGAGIYSNFGSPEDLSSGTASILYTPSAIGTFSFQAI
jgi:hypothetical protein